MREAFNAGKIETTAVINIEQIAINIIELVLISDGILLRKYISSGKRLILKTLLKNSLIFSIYIENKIPNTIPNKVANDPIKNPTIKNIFVIDLFRTPIDLSIAISLVLFLTNIVKPEIILKAATMIINESIINITFLSTLRAENKDLFKSDQVET